MADNADDIVLLSEIAQMNEDKTERNLCLQSKLTQEEE